MAQTDFTIKSSDTLPVLSITCEDDTGAAVDLTGCAAQFHMLAAFGQPAGVLKVNAAAVIDPDQVTNKGKVSYNWVAADTNTAGTYFGEFQITFPGGGIETWPDDANLNILIFPALG